MKVRPSSSGAGNSAPSKSEINDYEFQHSKEDVTDAVYECVKSLRRKNIVFETGSENPSIKSTVLAEKMVEQIITTIENADLTETEELFLEDEKMGIFEESEMTATSPDYSLIKSSSTSSSESAPSEYCPSPKQPRVTTHIPLDTKIKIVNMAREHPKWSVNTLQKNGGSVLKHKGQLKIWEKDIENGGTVFEKWETIDKWTYDRFVEARKSMIPVTTRTLQQWSLAAAMQYDNFDFTASARWVNDFKRRHWIRQRKVTKYIKQTEPRSPKALMESAKLFQQQVSKVIHNYDPDFVINTDQTGFEYRVCINRMLTHMGDETVNVYLGDLNEVTHSYTAQYCMTASGKLLPHVFICLQEQTGKFGPRVQTHINELISIYKNIIVTASKSGKLTSQLIADFLEKVLKPYVKQENFLLIIDSWGGQTNSSIFDSTFVNEYNDPTCQLKIIPPGCSPYCQPCDVYFYRQVTNFIKRLQNSTHLLKEDRQINSRDDALKIHSLIHHQLLAPIFEDMLKYAWFAAKLTPNRTVFQNVNEVCFPDRIRKVKCSCGGSAFILCSWCRKPLCFPCFYDGFHPPICQHTDLIKEESE